MDNGTIIPLFSTPIYSCDLDSNIVDAATPFLKSLEYHGMDPTGKTNTEFYTTNKFVLDLPECSDLRAEVMRGVYDYARSKLFVPPDIEFFITNSWTNRIEPGGGAAHHTHGNSIISGVFYLDVEDASGDLILHKDFNSSVPFPPQFIFEHTSYNIYNTKIWNFPPTNYKMILFPSGALHSIGSNCTNKPRWSLAFNIFVRGTISQVPLRQLRL